MHEERPHTKAGANGLTEIEKELVFLGTGTSTGVPLLGCHCAVCRGGHPKNQRTRSSIALGLPEGVLLVDTTPDMRTQLLREGVDDVGAVFYTHAHADHIFGMDDLRVFSLRSHRPTPIYCDDLVERRLRHSFDYCFAERTGEYHLAPRLEVHSIFAGEPFDALGARCLPLALMHGKLPILGLRIGGVAYCTDVKTIPEATLPLLADLDLLILGALRLRPHPTHMSLDEAIEAAELIGAKRTLFTHMSHDLDHPAVENSLPTGIGLAYDGLRAPLS